METEKSRPPSALMQALMPPQWWQFLLFLPLVGELPGVVVVLAIAVLPLAMAYVMLSKEDQPVFYSMAFMELAVLVHPAHAIWLNNGQWANCMAVAFSFPFIFWSGAAVIGAWCLAECTATGAWYVYAHQHRRERQQLRKRAEVLRAEWNFELPPELSPGAE